MRSYAAVAGRTGRAQRPATNGRSGDAPAPAAPRPAPASPSTSGASADMAAMFAGATAAGARDDPVVQDRYTFALFSLVGQRVQVWVADASVYEGILHTATFDNPEGLGVVLSMATRKRGTGPPLAARNRIIIQPQDFVQMVAVEAEFDDANDVRAAGAAAGFATDTAISGNRGAPARRRLEKADAWVSGSDRTGGLEEDGRGRRMRAGHWDQFEANERLFQVQSSFDENQYTTPLNIGSYTRQERERAARLAREIERKARGMKDNLTEEERFSSVARSRNTNNSRVTGTNNNNPARPQRPIRTHSDGSTGGSTYVPPHRRAEGEASPVATRTKPADGERGSEAPVAAVRGQRVNNVELNEATRRRQTEELRDFAVSSRRGRTASDAGTPEEASAGPEEVGSGGDAAAETPAAAPAPAPETPAAAAPATGSAPAPAATATATATTTSGAAAPAPAPAPLKSKLRAESSVFVPRSRQMPPQSMAMMGGPGMPAMSVMVQPGQPRMMQGPVFQMGPRGYMVPSMPPAMAMGRPVMGMQFPPQQRYMMGAPAWNGPPQMMGGPGMGGPPRGPGPAVAVAYGGGAAVPMRGPPGPHGMQASNQMLPGSPRTHARRVKGGKDGGKGNRGGPRGAPRGPPHGAGPAAAPRGQAPNMGGPRGGAPRGFPGRVPMHMQAQVHAQQVLPGAPPHPPQQQRR